MAINNQDGASARSDNRRMTGNINIYICSEAFDKDLNECRSSNGVKFRLDDTKTPGILSTNVDEKRQFDESDLLLDNVNKDKRERKVVIGEKNNEDLKILDNAKVDTKMSKREEKVKVKKEKKKSKGSDISNKNNTWFSYFWRKNDSDEKEKTTIGDEDLCTCKKKLNTNKKKNKKDDRKKRKTDGQKSVPSTKTHKIKNEPKYRRKTYDDSNLKTQEKSSNKKQNDNVREIPKSSSLSEQRKDVSKKNEPEKYSSTNKTDKSFGNNSSANEESYDSKKPNSETKSSTHKVKLKNKPSQKRDTAKTRKSKVDDKSLKNKRTDDENSFFTKFFNLFKSKQEVPKRKTKNKCNPGCTELKKTAKTSSSVQRRSKTKRKRYKSELAGKVKRSNLTERDFSTPNKCHIQVNENDRKNKKIGVCLTNDSSDMEGATSNYKKETHYLNEKYENERNIKPNKLLNSQDSKELIKKNLKETNIKDHKPISTQTNQINTNSENSLQLCFSCLFPSNDCLCRRNFPSHRCDCKKIVTFGSDDINKSTNDKRPHVSEVLPYQKTRNFSKVANEMQEKIDESTNTKDTQNQKYTCTCEECCVQNDHTADKKLRAKCYCKNLPCRCCVIEARRCTPKR